MLTAAQLKELARARLADAEALLASGRFDGAAYLCGYVVELALKARICTTLKWGGFPETKKDFDGLHSFKTHDLDILLRLCGREAQVKTKYFAEWSALSQWNPEARYQRVGTVSDSVARQMIEAAKVLLKKL